MTPKPLPKSKCVPVLHSTHRAVFSIIYCECRTCNTIPITEDLLWYENPLHNENWTSCERALSTLPRPAIWLLSAGGCKANFPEIVDKALDNGWVCYQVGEEGEGQRWVSLSCAEAGGGL